MNWRFLVHKDLSSAEKISIAKLKDQHWQYGVESQIRWMNENIYLNDMHLIGEKEAEGKVKIQAYITLSNVQVIIDGISHEFIGIGGVCVDKCAQHSGIGRQLMEKADEYLDEQKKNGILLCKDALVEFYRKCGWESVCYQRAVVKGKKYKKQIMLFKRECNCESITISRNF